MSWLTAADGQLWKQSMKHNKTSRQYVSFNIKGSTRAEYLAVSKGISANFLRDRWYVTKKCGFMVHHPHSKRSAIYAHYGQVMINEIQTYSF